jgi:DNA-binding transcriptional LysR family regulator
MEPRRNRHDAARHERWNRAGRDGEKAVIRDLKLRQLRLLVALDSERKLQLAAERLNITQSAASKMLAEIEALARVPLFERTARGVEPTAYGAILIRGGRSVLADLDQVTDEFAGYQFGELGTCRLERSPELAPTS